MTTYASTVENATWHVWTQGIKQSNSIQRLTNPSLPKIVQAAGFALPCVQSRELFFMDKYQRNTVTNLKEAINISFDYFIQCFHFNCLIVFNLSNGIDKLSYLVLINLRNWSADFFTKYSSDLLFNRRLLVCLKSHKSYLFWEVQDPERAHNAT